MNQANKPQADTLEAEKPSDIAATKQAAQPQPNLSPAEQQSEAPRAEAPKDVGNSATPAGGAQPMAQQPNKAAPQGGQTKR